MVRSTMDPARASGSGDLSGSDPDLTSDSGSTVSTQATTGARVCDLWRQWWERYPVHRHEREARGMWGAMPTADRVRALSALAWQIPAWRSVGHTAPDPWKYLRQRQWEDTPPTKRSAPRQTHQNAPGTTFLTSEGECAFHARGRNSGQMVRFSDSCHECRHVAARRKRRVEGEPETSADIIGQILGRMRHAD